MATHLDYDVDNRVIYVTTAPVSGIQSLDVQIDIYSDMKEDWKTDSTLNKFKFPIRPTGGDTIIPGTKEKSPFYFTQFGWKFRPYEADHTLYLENGYLAVDGGGEPWLSTIGDYRVLIRDSIPADAFTMPATAEQYPELGSYVWSEVLSGYEDGTAGYLLENVSAGADPAQIADAVWNEAISEHTSGGTFGAKNQLVVPSENVDDYKATDVNVSTSGIADAVWDENLVDHTAAGSFGSKNQLGVPSEDVDDYKATDVNVSSSGIADAVWDEDLADHTAVGSFGSKNQLGVPSEDVEDYKATDVNVSASGIADAVWEEKLVDHTLAGSFGGEVATKADVAASTSTEQISAASGSIIHGYNNSGSYSSTFSRDNVYWEIGEHLGSGLTVEFTFNLSGAESRPGTFNVFGRYTGVPTVQHHQELWAYNYETTSWEELADEFMPGGNTSDSLYSHEYYERHVDRANNNEVTMRIVHHVTTYNIAHALYLDYVDVTSFAVVTPGQIADAVWDETAAQHVTPGTFGANLATEANVNANEVKIDGIVTTLTTMVSDIWANATRTLTAGTKDSEIDSIKTQTDKLMFDVANNIQARVNAAGVLYNPSVGVIADGVWNELTSQHTAIGTFGAKNQRVVPSENVDDYKADFPTPVQISDQVWDENMIGHQTDGTAGQILRDSENPPNFESNINSIKSQTDKMTFDGSDNILANINDVGVLNDLSAAEVASAVWGAMVSSHVTPSTFGEAVRNILGLSDNNLRIMNQVYDSFGRLTSSTIRIYANAADCDIDQSHVAEYIMNASYDTIGRCTYYKVKKT
jgi:post-segregation antitoxin (ccd killing protein)